MQESIILAISSAEEFVKKIFNVSTVYVFKSYGNTCKAFGMFLISPGKILREPASVCIYANLRGELTYVTSLSASYISNVHIGSRREIAMILDMYNPPCVSTVEFLCYLSDIVSIRRRELETATTFELYREISDDNYIYMIYKSRELDPKTIASIIILMISFKSYLEKKIDEKCLEYIAESMREKLRVL